MVGGFDFEIIKASIPFLWDGMQLTLLLTVLAIGGGILGGTSWRCAAWRRSGFCR